jgi:tRNA/rRNA methyltransferase
VRRGEAPPRVVLVSPKHPGNVGAAARAMKNFGLAELWLVAPRCQVDREARALAAHAGDVLDAVRVVDTLDEALADRTLVVGTSARERASKLHAPEGPETALAALRGERGALLFGPEDTGLDNVALDRCQRIVTLPTAAYASLNLAQAVVVLAYLWHRDQLALSAGGGARSAPARDTVAPSAPPDHVAAAPRPRPVTEPRAEPRPEPHAAPRAAREQVEGMLGQLAAVALRSGYTDSRRLPSALRHFRAVFDRAGLSADEVARLRGLWRHLSWALEQPPERLPAPEARGDVTVDDPASEAAVDAATNDVATAADRD